MSQLSADLRLALRSLARSRGFALAAVLMLALGLGAAIALFSLIQGILLRPLPFHDPGRLVQLGEYVGDGTVLGVTARDLRAYQEQSSAFSSMGDVTGARFALGGGPVPETLPAARFSAGVFPTLGVQPVLGSVFTAQQEQARVHVTVLSNALWTGRFHRDPHIVGQVIQLDGSPYTVLGVMPAGFTFPLQVARGDEAQLWVPMSLTPDELSDAASGLWGYQIVARLRSGVTLGQAAEDAARVARQIMRDFPPALAKIRIRGDAQSLSTAFTGDTRPLLRVLSIAVGVVLLIVCANLAILLLVRALRAQREFAVRLALGARATAILRGTLAEGLLLSLAGSALGVLLAALALCVVTPALAGSIPRIDEVSINLPVALFALGLALAAGIFSSLVPAFVALRTSVLDSLKRGSAATSSSSGHARLRSALIVAEVAVAFILLTALLALLRSYQKMLAVDPGFQSQHLLVADYRLPEAQYPTAAAVTGFQRALVESLAHEPAIQAVGLGNTLPASGFSGMAGYTLEGQSAAGWKLRFAAFGTVYGEYFRALGIPLLAGRTFTDQDNAHAPLVVIVNQSMARHSWPGQDPLGKRMHVGNPRRTYPWATVIGVVGDTRVGGRDAEITDTWYAPAQQPAILYGSAPPQRNNTLAEGTLLVRAAVPPQQIAGSVRRDVAQLDPLLALDQVRSMDEVVSMTEAPRRIMTRLIGAFSVAALLLALTGIHAVMSFSVLLRMQEIAIRMALGARRESILRLVLRGGLRLLLVGSLLGMLGAAALSSLVRAYLFEVSATAPWLYLVSFLFMLGITLLASLLPALRAASTDPVRILRSAG